MFPYSIGVQAPTREKAKADFIEQVETLVANYPDDAEDFAEHLDAVVGTAGLLIELLSEEDGTDIAVSAAGHLTTKKSSAGEREVQSASVSVAAHRLPADPRKYAPVKAASEFKAEKGARDAKAKEDKDDKPPATTKAPAAK